MAPKKIENFKEKLSPTYPNFYLRILFYYKIEDFVKKLDLQILKNDRDTVIFSSNGYFQRLSELLKDKQKLQQDGQFSNFLQYLFRWASLCGVVICFSYHYILT